ncbi:MAG TPA: MFS transporter [Steroidobacteraceae bacterium]|nr:MFS transporter [Steroidobacteraceae bacterium]
MKKAAASIGVAWLITALYYFYQYVLRSAPAVMMPELSEAFGITTTGVAALAGLFYYGYSPFSLVAGVALDRFGPRTVVPLGAAVIGVGALLFASGAGTLAGAGRFLQGAGGVFALLGSVYLATTYFPASRAATLIGATQMFGMAGGFAGQIVVGPAIASGLPWSRFWAGMGIAGLVLCALLFALLPRAAGARRAGGLKEAGVALASVFRNPQSILCGLIAGLLFIPTTIFDMVWGVRYLQEGHGFDYGEAVMRSSTVPLGWMIGCPLLGFLSDRLGRRKPVIAVSALVLLGCLAWILYGPHERLPPYLVGIVAGTASGAAMITYSVIKEANPPQMSGTATGVVNFINFTLSALLGPVFGALLSQAAAGAEARNLAHYQAAFQPLLLGVVLAFVLTLLLRETGPAVRPREQLATNNR